MNKTYLIIPLLLFPLLSFSQNYPWEQMDLPDFNQLQERKITERSTDFYVVDSVYCYLFDNSSQMDVPYIRTYNLAFTADDGAILESVNQHFDPVLNEYVNSQREENIYDEDRNLIEKTFQVWDENAGAWINFSRSSNTPNEFGNYTLVLNQEWHTPTNSWRNLNKQQTIYNDDGYPQLLEFEEWDTVENDWKDVFRIVYAATPDGQIATTVFQLYLNGAYQVLSREVYSYDPIFTQLETERRADVWLPDSMDWQWSSRLVKEYDSNANLTSDTKQKWDINENNWLNETRSLINYNANGDQTLRTELTWDGQQWSNAYQIKSTYDSVFNKTRSEFFLWTLDQWQPSQTCDFYYSFHHEIVAVKDLQRFNCEIPNPYRTGTPIYCPDIIGKNSVRLAIFDLSGKLIHSKQIENQNFVNIAQSIPTGLYVLNISTGNGYHFSKKLVIVD